MQVGLIGVGRMGRVLALRLVGAESLFQVRIYDRDSRKLAAAAEELNLTPAASLEEAILPGTVILAVPDREVISLIKEFNRMKPEKPLNVINIATKVEQQVLENIAGDFVRCISVKFIGHADEMALGAQPVIVVNEQPAQLALLAQMLFAQAGKVVIGRADQVAVVNTTAANQALAAAVTIEEQLIRLGFSREMVTSAISQVASGVMKAYAADDLGPFAREIVQELRAGRNRSGKME